MNWLDKVSPKHFKIVEEVLGTDKCKIWWIMRNPHLDGYRPKCLVMNDRTTALYAYIESSRDQITLPWPVNRKK